MNTALAVPTKRTFNTLGASPLTFRALAHEDVLTPEKSIARSKTANSTLFASAIQPATSPTNVSQTMTAITNASSVFESTRTILAELQELIGTLGAPQTLSLSTTQDFGTVHGGDYAFRDANGIVRFVEIKQLTVPTVEYLFVPNADQRRRTAKVIEPLQQIGISEILVYQGDGDEIILQAGPSTHSLTFLLKTSSTIGMFRVNDFSEINFTKLSADPTRAELFEIAKNYSSAING